MNKLKKGFIYIATAIFITVLSMCTYDKEGPPLPNGCYPDNIAKIIMTKCAISGCHNTQSKQGAGGFDLSSWDHLFEGGGNGSSVIPYRPDQSFLMFFINTYPDLGPVNLPTMPVNGQPLSREEVVMVRDWIHNGAPDCKGNVWLSDDPGRKKFYVTNQGCDIVTVFDSKTRLPMRMIDVGVNPNQIEVPHDVIVSPDGNYWYVIFSAAQVMQKFRTSDDSYVGQVVLGSGNWSSMVISKDSHYAFVVNFEVSGSVAFVDLQTMTLNITYTGLASPHGSAVSSDFKTLYVTAQTGNYIFKYDITDPMNPQEEVIKLEIGPQIFISKFDPHQIVFSPSDSTKYYVTCQTSNEIRVMRRIMTGVPDTLIAVIPTGDNPQELEFSQTYPYLFVSCMDDASSFPGWIGSVTAINYNTDTYIKSIFTGGYQPHGIAVDDYFGVVYVANRNVSSSGPAPHHTSTCGGRNGNVTMIDMTAVNPAQMEIVPGYKIEVSVDPYKIAVRK